MMDTEEPMDTSENIWYWFRKAECDVWHRVEEDPESAVDSSQLERYYLQNPQGILRLTTEAGEIVIDFSGQIQTNLRTGQKWWIKRHFSNFLDSDLRCTCRLSLPAYWENMDPKQPYLVFPVKWDSREFMEVKRHTQNYGLLQNPIQNIYRIQNIDLWELYCRKKAQLMRIKGQSDIEEQKLFHGTNRDNLHSICTYNFECRMSDMRRRSHVYGKGTYFAKYASYADNYSIRNPNKTKVMVLARVIVGKYKVGQFHLCKPDGDQKQNEHDSCVDELSHPKIYVIFDPNQIYPEYVIEY